MEQSQAAIEVMAQLDAADGPLALDQIEAIDRLGPMPWLSYTERRSPAAVIAWRAIAEQLPASDLASVGADSIAANDLTFSESEAPEETGGNDTAATGDLISGFGTGEGDEQVVTISGALQGAEIRLPIDTDCESDEDDGSITDANDTPTVLLQVALCAGVIGDGPFGETSGDVDFYTIGSVKEGTRLIFDISNASSSLDPVSATVGIYDAEGNLIASFDDDPNGGGFLDIDAPADGVYYGAVAGLGGLPSDPTDPASGPGVTETGTYEVFSVAFRPPCVSEEDDGSFDLANTTIDAPGDLGTIVFVCSGDVGDGPQAEANGDVDFFRTRPLSEDRLLIVDISGEEAAADLTIGIYNSAGELVASGQDDPTVSGPFTDPFSILTPAADVYYVAIGGGLPEDPTDPTTGTNTDIVASYTNTFIVDADKDAFGGGALDWAQTPTTAEAAIEARAEAFIQANAIAADDPIDIDFFLVELEKGDAIAGGFNDSRETGIFDPAGVLRASSTSNRSFSYPEASPLRHIRSNGFDHVATESGTYAVYVNEGIGAYEGELRVIRPGLSSTDGTDLQIIFLDFDGGTISGDVFGTGFDANLSPLSDFMAGWDLGPGDIDAVIDATIDAVVESLDEDLRVLDGRNGDRDSSGTPGEFDMEILNSRDHGDQWGNKNVSRVVIGGTQAELGIPTLGIAQSIDPGNAETEETAVTLLDVMSSPAGNGASLNTYGLAEGVEKADFVGFAVGHITAHEIGHFIGNWHQETFNEVEALMDAGGDFPAIAGVGEDDIFGNADDTDPDFVEDIFNVNEGWTGLEDTSGRSAFAFSTGLGLLVSNPITDLTLEIDGVAYPGEPVDIYAEFTGGVAPFSVTVDWGDGSSCPGDGTCLVDPMEDSMPGLVDADYTYSSEGPYTITVMVTDANGSTASVSGETATCTIVGTSGAETLRGTPGDDVICGLGGNDRIFGEGGNDVLIGGSGRDRMEGGAGDDTMLGGSEADTMNGGDGVDTMSGGKGNDIMRGGNDADVMNGRLGGDRMFGQNGNDVMIGNRGNDRMYGGNDNDVMKGRRGADIVSGQNGDDDLSGGQGRDNLNGGRGTDTCLGGTGTNSIAACEL